MIRFLHGVTISEVAQYVLVLAAGAILPDESANTIKLGHANCTKCSGADYPMSLLRLQLK